MLGRNELRELEYRIDKLERDVQELFNLESVVQKLESAVTSTKTSVDNLSTYIVRLEERSQTKERWAKSILPIGIAVLSIVAGMIGYGFTETLDKIEKLETSMNSQHLAITELATKLKLLSK